METRRLLVTLAVLAVLFVSAANAENIYLTSTAGDGSGESSFLNNDLGYWNNGVGEHPVAGNDYIFADNNGNSGTYLRTPTGNGSYTFAGDSLTVGNLNGTSTYGARFFIAGGSLAGENYVVTINDLTCTDQAFLDVAASGTWTTRYSTLAGNITLKRNENIDPNLASLRTNLRYTSGSTTLYITADITGDGSLDAYGASNSSGNIYLRGQNTYTGSTAVSCVILRLDGGGSLLLDINDTDNSDIHGSSSNPGNLILDGKINLDVSDITASEGSWTLFDVTSFGSGTVAYNSNFLIGLNGGDDFTEDTGVWTLVDDQREWTFTEETGVLSLAAVPEPTTMGLLLAGGLGVVLRRKQ